MSAGKAGRNGRMSVYYCAAIGTLLVASQVHLYHRRGTEALGGFKYVEVIIYKTYLFGSDKCLADTCLRSKILALGYLYCYIAVNCGNPAFLPELVADIDHLFFYFFVHIYILSVVYFICVYTTPFWSIMFAYTAFSPVAIIA